MGFIRFEVQDFHGDAGDDDYWRLTSTTAAAAATTATTTTTTTNHHRHLITKSYTVVVVRTTPTARCQALCESATKPEKPQATINEHICKPEAQILKPQNPKS